MHNQKARSRRLGLTLIVVVPILVFAFLFERASWRPRMRRVYKNAVFALQFSRDGQVLASAGASTKNFSYSGELSGFLRVEMMNARSLRSLKTLPLLPPVSEQVAFSPDLKRIVTVPPGLLGLRLIDLANGETLWTEQAQRQNGRVTLIGLQFSPRGDQVSVCAWVSGGDSTFWSRYFVETQKLKTAPQIYGDDGMDELSCTTYSPDSRSFVVGNQANILALYDTKTNKKIWAQKRYVKEDTSRWIEALAFAPDGKTIASGHNDNSVCLWNEKNGHLLRALNIQPSHAHSTPLQILVFSPDSTTIARGSQDGIIVISSTRSGEILRVLDAKNGAVTALTFAPDGKYLAAGYANGTISLWRVR